MAVGVQIPSEEPLSTSSKAPFAPRTSKVIADPSKALTPIVDFSPMEIRTVANPESINPSFTR